MIGIVGLDCSKLCLPYHQLDRNQQYQDEHSYPSGDADDWDVANQKEHPAANRHVPDETRVAISPVDLILNGGGGFGLSGIDRSRTIAAPDHAGVYEFVTLWTWKTAQLFGDHGLLLCKISRRSFFANFAPLRETVVLANAQRRKGK